MKLGIWARSDKVVRQFLLFWAIVLFLVIFSLTYSIINTSAPFIVRQCSEGKTSFAVFTYEDGPINTKQLAKTIVERVFDEQHEFVKNVIDECGIGYVFSGASGRRLVCENGKVYEYGTTCNK